MAVVWAATGESEGELPKEITAQLAPYREKYKAFRVVVMRSGTEDLFEPTLTLLLRNRMKKALDDVRSENEQKDKTAV